ncbi:MAG TPA: PQQ-binding-like beta-propeller repeat protein [Planctomycetota bacterium]|nr:PQQ-binding-like beta-propeller repeat protein [Planctomycetota bacterium]
MTSIIHALLFAAFAVLQNSAIAGEAGGKTSATALLGSPTFFPSSEHPVGWRGDGSGRFPGATPPLEWYRRPAGAFTTLRVLAGRPKGNAAEGQPLNMGAVREWLVAGPFDAKDHATALDDVALPDEATLQAAVGESVNGKAWTPATISVANQSQNWSRLVLDFTVLYGRQSQQEWQNHPGSLEPAVAYASTHIYSAAATKVLLQVAGTKVRAWLNGAPLAASSQREKPPTVELVQGWNRLTVKVAASKNNWNVSALISPLPGTTYETKNIVWMAPMPGPSWSSPVVVGSKVLVNADEGTLVCLNKQDGQVLWTRSTTFFHVTTDDARAKFPDVAPKVAQLDQLLLTLPDELNANVSADGNKSDANQAMHAKIKQKSDLERSIREMMGKADKTYNCWNNDRGWSISTPVCDGRNVYVAYYGGIKGVGASALACFDLEGNRLWGRFTGQTDVYEHGQHSTPVLSGKVLVHLSGKTISGYDQATGRQLWQRKAPAFGNVQGVSPIAVKAGDVDAVLVVQAGLYRTSDGAELWASDVKDDIITPVQAEGIVYGVNYGISAIQVPTSSYYAVGFPQPTGDTVKPQFLVRRPWRELEPKFQDGTNGTSYYRCIIGSPLYHDGLVYVVSEGGALVVVDAKAGKGVYTRALEALNPRLTWVFAVGICTGPTLAGKYVHIRDDQSQTLVIAPGPEYQELAKNVLWELQPNGGLQEAQSNPFYEGGRIYYRTQGFLYCIGEQ